VSWTLAVALVLPLLTGYLLVDLLWPVPRHFALKSFLAVGLGLGCTSCLFFLLLLAGASREALVAAELVVVTGLGIARSRRGRTADGIGDVARPASRGEPFLGGALVLALVLAATTFVALSSREPHGGDPDNWDSWAQWNLRARLIHRLGAQWAPAFSSVQGRSYTAHPDYPLLLPASVARGWNLLGRETTLVPMALAFLFTFATVGLVVSSLGVLRDRSLACLGGLALLGLPPFLQVGAWQYADMPLALFFLTTLVLLCLHDRSPGGPRGLLVLAGLSTGLATWTKNEGWLFLVAVVVARWFALRRGRVPTLLRRQLLWWSVGVLPVLACVVFFKWHFAAANDLVSGLGLRSTLHRVLDLSRPLAIVRIPLEQVAASSGWTASIWVLAPCAWLLGFKAGSEDRRGLATLGVSLTLLVAGYVLVYVVTPMDLEWHLRTSVLRLLVQVWPSSVLACLLAVSRLDVGRGPARS
jgi:hypothetical protein